MKDRTILKWLCEFGPLVVFLFVSRSVGFTNATTLLVILTVISLATQFFLEHRIAWFPLTAGLFVVSSGSLSLIFANPSFFAQNDTLYNGIFGIAIAVGLYGFDRTILKDLFSALFLITDKAWIILSKRFMCFFIIVATANGFAAANLTPDEWIKYKTWEITISTCFCLYQFTVTRRERLPSANKWGMNVSK